MDTPNDKSWKRLTARARNAAAPDIDVHAAVMRNITARRVGEIPPLLSGRWLAGALATLTLLAAGFGYSGLRALPELSFAIGFSTSF